MKVTVRYSRDALRQLKKLEPAISKRIVLKVADNTAQNDPLARAKPLQGRLSGKYRYRIGEYRVIFIVDAEGVMSILTVLHIAHRRDVYK